MKEARQSASISNDKAKAPPDSTTQVPELSEEDIAIKRVLETLSTLNGPAREAAVMKLAQKVKVKILGKEHTAKGLIVGAIAAKAAPHIHAVIRDEVIRLGVGRREYHAVVVPLFNRIDEQNPQSHRLEGCVRGRILSPSPVGRHAGYGSCRVRDGAEPRCTHSQS